MNIGLSIQAEKPLPKLFRVKYRKHPVSFDSIIKVNIYNDLLINFSEITNKPNL